MAGLRTALRLAPRSSLRSIPTSRTTSRVLSRAYAVPARRPADDRKAAEEAELAQEDLNDETDPGMVCLLPLVAATKGDGWWLTTMASCRTAATLTPL